MSWTVETKEPVIDDLRWFGKKDGRMLLKEAERRWSADPLQESHNRGSCSRNCPSQMHRSKALTLRRGDPPVLAALWYNSDMAAKVKKTGELGKALDQQQGDPVFLVDLDGNTTHVVLPVDDARRMFADYLRRELQVGFDEADRGEFVDWDPDKVKAEGREELQRRSQAS